MIVHVLKVTHPGLWGRSLLSTIALLLLQYEVCTLNKNFNFVMI